ncbi:MAG: ABC transporter ATP-binding protein [Patescibacteria group bacterium]|nr:ABC transporter ATP-binding protein [Patescibacteria group bacterium]MDD4611232.1 ABC transporter ATP-binding protein [Patescibacteria group bacterium]
MLEGKNINKTYQSGDIETTVLKNINFKINTGEFVAIMGPSGSGKSTLMNIIGCLDTPTSGQYLIDNQDVSTFSDDELAELRTKKIGFVFQAFNLLPRATVLRNVTLPLIYADIEKEEREAKAKKALTDSAFPEKFWLHHSNQLSGGMMQRVAIARALVNNPALILADEPTGNLDTKTGQMVLETFQKLHTEQGRTIVLITHERYIAEFAQRIIHIRDGEIIKDEKMNVKNNNFIVLK